MLVPFRLKYFLLEIHFLLQLNLITEFREAFHKISFHTIILILQFLLQLQGDFSQKLYLAKCWFMIKLNFFSNIDDAILLQKRLKFLDILIINSTEWNTVNENMKRWNTSILTLMYGIWIKWSDFFLKAYQ